MTPMSATKELCRLWKKWGTSKEGPDVNKLMDFIRRELKAAISGEIKCTEGLIREMRGELVLCGKIRKAISLSPTD